MKGKEIVLWKMELMVDVEFKKRMKLIEIKIIEDGIEVFIKVNLKDIVVYEDEKIVVVRKKDGRFEVNRDRN